MIEKRRLAKTLEELWANTEFRFANFASMRYYSGNSATSCAIRATYARVGLIPIMVVFSFGA
jgi:hypothetical protein